MTEKIKLEVTTSYRMQRVHIGSSHSSCLQLNGGMPQGSWLGPLSFLLLIDDLQIDCQIHKYVDDTTLTEIITVEMIPLICKTSFTSY